jgi:glycosyltransferase involved in cell wall biosynthesis
MSTSDEDLGGRAHDSLIFGGHDGMEKRDPGYDVIHVVHGSYPEDPRVRREAAVAADVAERVLVICLRQPGRPNTGHYARSRIVRLPGRKSRGSVVDYVREYLMFTVRVFLLFARDERFRRARVVHLHTLPDFLVFAAMPAIREGARSILDMHEIFPEFIRSKFPGVLGLVAMFPARFLERASRARATVTITVNRPIRELLTLRRARKDERIEVVHNAADSRDMGDPAPRNYTVRTPVRLVYHGTLTHLYGLDIAIEAVALARASGASATLDIYGDGPATNDLNSLTQRLRVAAAISFHGSVPYTRLRRELPTFDAGLIPTRLDVMTHYSLSTKLLELFHLGVPVIASRIPTYVEYFPDNCAWYFTPNDARSAAVAIKDFVSATDDQRRDRALAARAVAERLAWPAEAARLATIYRQLLSQSTGS